MPCRYRNVRPNGHWRPRPSAPCFAPNHRRRSNKALGTRRIVNRRRPAMSRESAHERYPVPSRHLKAPSASFRRRTADSQHPSCGLGAGVDGDPARRPRPRACSGGARRNPPAGSSPAPSTSRSWPPSARKCRRSSAKRSRRASAIRTLFLQNVLDTREADKREFVFLSQLQSQATISWVAFGWPDGSFFAAHKLGDRHLEMMEISLTDHPGQRRVDEYAVIPGDIEFETRRFVPTDFQRGRPALVQDRHRGRRAAMVQGSSTIRSANAGRSPSPVRSTSTRNVRASLPSSSNTPGSLTSWRSSKWDAPAPPSSSTTVAS